MSARLVEATAPGVIVSFGMTGKSSAGAGEIAAIRAVVAVIVSNGTQSGPRLGIEKGPLTGLGTGLSR